MTLELRVIKPKHRLHVIDLSSQVVDDDNISKYSMDTADRIGHEWFYFNEKTKSSVHIVIIAKK